MKYVKAGQPVEVSLDLYPGQIFNGRVDQIWRGNGIGQFLPSDDIPKFQQPPASTAQGQYAVKIYLDDSDPLEVFDWRTGVCRHLYRWQARRMGRAAQNLDPGSLVV